HQEKLARLMSKLDLFGQPQRQLEFYPFKIRVGWRCERLDGSRRCPGHTATVLDWGLGELARKAGPEKAVAKMESLADLNRYDLRFYMGNFKAHPKNFGIVSLWYPLRAEFERHAYEQGSLLL
ncbi:MAG TPA: hypothetical protein VK458_10455, partial [Myxococcaceae bacterium]|nr:hypothetical protein [Myxococcaceae bacterium]